MDIIKFNSPTSATKLEHGEVINGLTSKMWIERYDKAGEFKFVANADSGLRDALPIGSLISHVDTTEVMMVENHEISDERGQKSELEISGQGFETFFDNRIVGSNKTFPTYDGPSEYTLAVNPLHTQIIALINDHILAANVTDPDNAIPYVTMTSTLTGDLNQERIVKRGTLYSRVLELLAIEDFGIKVIRPGSWSPLGSSPNIAIEIHKGVDRSSEVIFSADTGEIESSDYLWSNKKYKNCAMVTGKWIEVFVDTTETGINRRMMLVDGKDIDDFFDAPPEGDAIAPYTNLMIQRGQEVLAAQKNIALTKAEVSRNTNKAAYRTDFDVGDLITVSGDYSETASMRISEYVEIEDENGSSGYPTLTTP